MRRELSALELELLELGSEDYYGLWEIRFILQARLPGEPEAEVLRKASEIVHDLIADGLLALYLEIPEGEPRTIAHEEVAPVLSNRENWLPRTSREPYIAFAATDEGERVWRQSIMHPPRKEPEAGLQP